MSSERRSLLRVAILMLSCWTPTLWATDCSTPPTTCNVNICAQNFDAMVQTDLDELIACHEALRLQPRENSCPPQHHSERSRPSRREIYCRRASDGKDETDFVLATVERALRKRGDLLEQSIAATKAANQKQTKAQTTPQEKADTAQQQADDMQLRAEQLREKAAGNGSPPNAADTDEDKLAKIERTIVFSENGRFVNADKYDDFFFRLNTGYEFVAVDRFLDKGEPRIAFLLNDRLGGASVTDAVDGFHPLRYGGRLSFTAQLESSAEVTPTLEPSDQKSSTPSTPMSSQSAPLSAAKAADDTSKAANDKVTKSFNFELQYTWVLFRTRVQTAEPEDPKTATSANLRHYLGLIATVGGLKTDDQPKIAQRTYGGLRWAINPELYTDVLWGKTSGLRSDRLEVRGQIPVYALTNGDKVYLGGIGNFALNKRHRELTVDSTTMTVKSPPESDAVRIYITFNTDLKRILGGNNS